jgi:hypothetical protein
MDERGQGFQSHSQTSERWLQIFRVRQPTLDYSLPHRSPERKSRQITFSEPEELLWRRANRPATEVPKDEVHQVASDYFEPTAARTFQRSEAIDQSPVSERAPLQITKLDPGLLDRLTDDVIRRVEQRARIERQRRGL